MKNEIRKTRRTRATHFTVFAAFALLALCLPGAASAQWTAPDAAGNIKTTNTGNVGIGTTSAPTGKLEIHVPSGAPDVRLTSDAVTSPFTFGGVLPANLGARFTLAGQNEGGLAAQGFSDSNAPAFRFQGYVGSTAPTLMPVIFEGFKSNGGGDRAPLGASEKVFGFYNGSFDSGGSLLMTLTGAGNVGLGTAVPGERLTVFEGNAHASGAAMWATGSVRVTNTGAPGGWRFAACSPAGDNNCPGNGSAIHQDGVATRIAFTHGGNVGVGTSNPASKLHVVGDITVDGNINAKYQDLAEWVPTTQKLAAGTVVILDVARDNHVLASSSSYDTRVAGVISAQPGIALGEGGENKALVATTGRVKVKVDATQGAISVGDLLVTSERQGYAMKSEPVPVGKRQMHSPGTIIGKALESLASGTGEILVLLSLQ